MEKTLKRKENENEKIEEIKKAEESEKIANSEKKIAYIHEFLDYDVVIYEDGSKEFRHKNR